MGSDNSKAKNADRKNEDKSEAFQFGQPKQSSSARSHVISRPVTSVQPQKAFVSKNITEMPLPPPYSSIDTQNKEVTYTERSSTAEQDQIKPVPIPRTSQINKNCTTCKNHLHESAQCPFKDDYANHPVQRKLSYPDPSPCLQPTIEPLAQKYNNNQYKWTASQVQNLAEPTKVELHHELKLTPQPYDSQYNPYVWTHPPTSVGQTKACKIIDLSLELPKIKQKIKESREPNFQKLNKQLNKNKPLSDIRLMMVNNKYLSDVKFHLGETVFYGHKMILITASFLFYEHFHLKGETEMKIESINVETFEKVIRYCYTDQIKITEENILEILLAATTLQVRQIVNACHGLITNLMNHETIFIIFNKALEQDSTVIEKKCLDFINKNEDQCFKSKGFFEISLPSLMKILEFCKYPREKVSEIVEKWTNGDMGQSIDKTETAKHPHDVEAPAKGAVKKVIEQKKTKAKNIPSLLTLPFPTPVNQSFPYPPPNMEPQFQQQMHHPFYPQNMTRFLPPNVLLHNIQRNMYQVHPTHSAINPIRPFAGSSSSNLINNDDDDDKESIISKDDEVDEKIKVKVNGPRHQWQTEISRIDLVCKRSMLLHEVRFSENLALNSKEVQITVTAFDNGKKIDLISRTIKINKSSLNLIRFNRNPLKIYVGQKFFIKLKFSENAQRLNINAESLSTNSMMELRKDAETKKYFNCIISLFVSEMP